MTDRIAELRALRQAERSALGGNDLMPWASAADVLRGALHDDCDALLDCADALDTLTLVVGLAAFANAEQRDVVQEVMNTARAALARLNGEHDAKTQ